MSHWHPFQSINTDVTPPASSFSVIRFIRARSGPRCSNSADTGSFSASGRQRAKPLQTASAIASMAEESACLVRISSLDGGSASACMKPLKKVPEFHAHEIIPAEKIQLRIILRVDETACIQIEFETVAQAPRGFQADALAAVP